MGIFNNDSVNNITTTDEDDNVGDNDGAADDVEDAVLLMPPLQLPAILSQWE